MEMPSFISIQWLLFFTAPQFLVCVSASVNSTSTWAKLQISPDTLCSMPFGYFRVSIYEHFNNHKSTTLPNQKRYYYDPIALLDHKSATSKFNNVTKKAEMTFRVEMWNDLVQNEVVNYLPQIVGHQINPNLVQVIAFEQMLLASIKPSSSYTLSTEWYPYKLEKFMLFTLTCFELKDCDQLRGTMLKNPEEYHNLKLLLSLAYQTSQTKETTIRLENAVTGKMASTLLQKFKSGTDPLLAAEDKNRLLSEMATSVMLETFDNSDIISSQSETQIYNTIKDMIVSSKITISKQTDKMWASVFWNNDNYRPDKTSKQLNEIYNRQGNEIQRKMVDAFKNSNVAGFGVGVDDFSFSATIDLSREGSSTKEDLDRLQQESKDHVEWDGEKFVPKPMELTRINLGSLRDTQKVQDRRVRVRYSTAVLSTPIRFTQFNGMSMENELKDVRKVVVFDAYRNSSFVAKPFSFDHTVNYLGVNVNVGGGMDISTGVFTVPTAGIYSFEFHGLCGMANTRLFLKLNGYTKATAYHHSGERNALSMSATLQLKVNDKVSVVLNTGYLYDTQYEIFTHFCGRLL